MIRPVPLMRQAKLRRRTTVNVAAKKQSKRQDSTRTVEAKREAMRRRAVRRDIRVLGYRQGV
jgi:hypothetical protein